MSAPYAIAALLLIAACLLAIVLIFDDATREPKPPPRVRLEERKTWRRESAALSGAWVHIAGALAISIEIYLLTHAL